ncbi:hypothetical protein D3C87_1727630 [compost metagenome]
MPLAANRKSAAWMKGTWNAHSPATVTPALAIATQATRLRPEEAIAPQRPYSAETSPKKTSADERSCAGPGMTARP